MYMGPIVAEPAVATAPQRTPFLPALRMAVGVPVLLLAALVMLPWIAVVAASAGAVLAVRAILNTPRALAQAADYAGRVALGR